MRRHLVSVLLLTALPIVVFGCGSDSDPAPMIPTSTPGTSALSTSKPRPATDPAGKPVLSKSGGCGDAFFWAANADGTIAVTVTVDVRPRSATVPTAIDFTVPDPKVKLEIQRGRDLTQPFCSDVITSDWHVDARERAAGGKGRIVVDPPLPAGHCGSKGRLHIGDLVTDAGTHFAALDAQTTSIGCYAG